MPDKEQSRPHQDRPATTTPTTGNARVARPSDSAAQLPFDYSGRDQADRNADDWWRSEAMAAIKALAKTGRTFEAFDLVEDLGLAEPDHPCRWGGLFGAAARAGLIVSVGAKPSRRPTAAGHLCRTWRGAA